VPLFLVLPYPGCDGKGPSNKYCVVVSRVVFDRGYTDWDDGLTSMKVDCATMTPDSMSDYVRHIRHNSM